MVINSSFQYKKYGYLDNIELFCSENETDYFPFHFHDYYCISLITKGTEQLDTPDQSFYAVRGSISVTQINEVHKNHSIDSSGYSYKTLYVNPDLLTHFSDHGKITHLERVIDDNQLVRHFANLFNEQVTFNAFERVLKKLTGYSKNQHTDNPPAFDLVDELTDRVPFKSISLDWLSAQFCMSKFHFVRVFKNTKGISPQAYIMLRRLKNAKTMLLNEMEPGTVAFLNGFYDIPHLNTAFKRYFGITLSMIKNSKIIQSQ